MSIVAILPRWASPARPAPLARWAGLGLLGGVEAVTLSLRFRAPTVPAGAPWWAWPLGQARELWVPALLGAGTTLALAGLRSARAGGSAGAADPAGLGGRIAAHLAALTLFVAVTARVFEADVFAAGWPAAWVLGWYAAGLAVAVTWFALGHPAGWPGVLGRPGLLAGAAGLAVGAGAVAAGQCAGQLWLPLARATLELARFVLGLVATDVVADPDRYLLGVGGFVVRIAPTCSGYEGVGLVWVFLAVYLPLSRRSLRWPHAWLLVPLGTLAIWLVNAARIVALILIGAWASPAVALGGFHSQAGSLGILGISLGLVLASRRLACFAAAPPAADPVDPADSGAATTNPTAAYLAPFLAIVATTMLTGAVAAGPGLDAGYPLRIIAGGLALWAFRRCYPGRLIDWSWSAAGVGVAVFALWVALEPANPAGSSGLRAAWGRLPAPWAWAWLGFRAVGSTLVVPIAEEWAFRGYLARRLIAADFESVRPGRFTWASFLLSSAAFGLLHGRWLAGMLAGLIYAGVYYRRGRVGDAALAHAVTNGLIAATVLATGDWTLWS